MPPAEPEHNPNRASLPPIKGRIEFERVCFRYRPDTPEVLSNIDLTIEPGEMLGIKQKAITANGRLIPLTPGMAVQADIKTGQCRIIQYLLSPI